MNPLERPFEPLPSHPTEATAFVCALCGARFMHGGQVCGACPMTTKCLLVKCPNCGFQFPRESRLVAFFQRLFARKGVKP
jgi:predicted amidophosphoribosyltransferase